MNQLVRDFLEKRLSRRAFAQALGAVGITLAGVRSVVRSAEEADRAPRAIPCSGTGGEGLVAQMKAAGVRYVFTNPGSFEVGFFDASKSRK